MESRSVLSRRHSHASPQPYSVRIAPSSEAVSNPAGSSSLLFHTSKEPIVPEIFDALAANPNDPAIVRYSPATGEIAAASPARIIAQITSENFLDYELLSDFFLGVRAYLSTNDLLAYLLARFEWAINRFDDDGRVVRVRAFAALRHWILNYFPYDFVIDRELRVKFCERLNAMSRTVRERSVHGASDLKLILDLKKCWNGRCALYWDSSSTEVDGRHDVDINPGGIVGSRDSDLSHPSQLWQKAVESVPPQTEEILPQEKSESALHDWFDAVLEAEKNESLPRERQSSIATSRSLPTSPESEQSIPAMSCSIPGKGLRKVVVHPNQSLGAHPVPIAAASRRVCPAAPSALSKEKTARPKDGHKRSGSFSDAVRDNRAPLPFVKDDKPEEHIFMAIPYAGSLIRGGIFPPGSPYMDGFAPTSPATELPSLSFSSQDDDDSEDFESSRITLPMSPGVKHLFGSIRRALSSKQTGSHHSSTMGGPSIPSIELGKSSALHAYVNANGEQPRIEVSHGNTRIDLLCADASEAFQRAMLLESRENLQHDSSVGLASGNEQDQRLLNFQQSGGVTQTRALRPDQPQRNQSEVTFGSQSILIVDDTGYIPPLPAMPSVLAAEHKKAPNNQSFSKIGSETPPLPDPKDQISSASQIAGIQLLDVIQQTTPSSQLDNPLDAEQISTSNGRPHDSVTSRRPVLLNNSPGKSFRSTYSGSLRRYASFQSGMAKYAPEYTLDATAVSEHGDSSENVIDKPAGRMLRRRPGGDLRANQNVHDLEQTPRPKSAGSIATYSDSMGGSGRYTNRTAKNSLAYTSSQLAQRNLSESAVHSSKKTPSLVRTHSSQPALRPSFEAAVAEFARIPDDDEGGIEATLLKLEGRYEKIPADLSKMERHEGSEMITEHAPQEKKVEDVVESTDMYPEHDVEDIIPAPTSPELRAANTGDFDQDREGNGGYRNIMTSSIYVESEESYDSTPLLERGLSNRSRRKGNAAGNHTRPPIPRSSGCLNPDISNEQHSSLRPSFESGTDTFSRFRRLSSVPTTTDSFLLDEDEYLSDLSSELSMDSDERDELIDRALGSPGFGYHEESIISNVGSASHPSQHPYPPPVVIDNGVSIAAQVNQTQDQHRPPTPDPSPVSRIVVPVKSQANTSNQLNSHPILSIAHDFPNFRHMPFVLAFDSELLLQQLTIVERDALNEINWRDLIEMRWNHKSPSTLNWVEYLNTHEPNGIDLVTARFNIMVKWVLSEIVLTQSIEERALCIMRYIHVALQARKAHNYVTLLQFTIALTSIDCTRLTKTWDMVPATEKTALRELETLVTPIKNFHNLRQEMETANAEEGCIPVVGESSCSCCHSSQTNKSLALYIHDLTYNSQKPAQVPSTPEGEPLINFERYRTAAGIVKSLLRLIDASAKYTFQPVEGVIERCLWVASLSDEMIRTKSKELE